MVEDIVTKFGNPTISLDFPCQVATDIAPFLTELFNRPLAVGHFPSVAR